MSNKSKSNTLKLTSANSSSKEEIAIALIGPVGVGKSAFMVKYITKRFIGEYDPNFEGCRSKLENVDGSDLIIQMYDTFVKDQKKLDKFIKWSDYLILFYSIDNYESFLSAQDYLESINELVKNNIDEYNGHIPIKVLLLGNKIDLERFRQVNKADVDSIIEKYSSKKDGNQSQSIDSPLIVSHMEATSCEEYEIVHNVIYKVVREIRNDREANHHFNPLHISEENAVPGKGRAKLQHSASNAKRSKSPKAHLHESISASSVVNQNFLNGVNTNTPNALIISNQVNVAKDQKKSSSKFPFLKKILNNS